MLDPRHKEGGPATTTRPPQQVAPTSTTAEIVPEGADRQRIGDLVMTWVGIAMDTVDAMVADAQAKVDALPEYRTLMALIGELTVRMIWLETEVQQLKGERR
jgi:hypothetical protein